jgi:hypothetical protein
MPESATVTQPIILKDKNTDKTLEILETDEENQVLV